jgi:hypothetical protein
MNKTKKLVWKKHRRAIQRMKAKRKAEQQTREGRTHR